MKTGIIIITFNIDPRIFIMQMEAIKKYCTDEDYTVEIIDNSSDEAFAESIKHHSGECNVNYRRTMSDSKDPSVSHSFAAGFAYEKVKELYDIIFFMDHDLIPVDKFSVSKLLNGKKIASVVQGTKTKYPWPGCLIVMNNEIDQSLVDFSPNHEMKLDTGGELYKLAESVGEDQWEQFDEVGCHNEQMKSHKRYYFYLLIAKRTFIHFINSSNWAKSDRQDERINSLINISTNLMQANDIRGD